jgi:hypothetical protein
MKCVLVIEAKASVLQLRRDILRGEGYKTTGMLTTGESFPEVPVQGISAISVGHSLPWSIRAELIAALKTIFPDVPTVALLRQDEAPLAGATFNYAADNPMQWLRTIDQACDPSGCYRGR